MPVNFELDNLTPHKDGIEVVDAKLLARLDAALIENLRDGFR